MPNLLASELIFGLGERLTFTSASLSSYSMIYPCIFPWTDILSIHPLPIAICIFLIWCAERLDYVLRLLFRFDFFVALATMHVLYTCFRFHACNLHTHVHQLHKCLFSANTHPLLTITPPTLRRLDLVCSTHDWSVLLLQDVYLDSWPQTQVAKRPCLSVRRISLLSVNTRRTVTVNFDLRRTRNSLFNLHIWTAFLSCAYRSSAHNSFHNLTRLFSQGDSTQLEVDCIVNAANGSLLGQFTYADYLIFLLYSNGYAGGGGSK